MSAADALWMTPLLPMLTAVLVACTGRWPNVREGITFLSGAGLIALVVVLIGTVDSEAYTLLPASTLVLAEPIPGFPIALRSHPFGLLFAGIAASLWLVTSLYAVGYLRGTNESHQTRFFTCFAIAIAAAMGIALSANLLTLFVFYEILTFSTYPLVTHKGNEAARRGGRIYLLTLVGSSVGLLLPALVLTGYWAGTTEFTLGGLPLTGMPPAFLPVLIALFLFGIGKAAVMPMHRWLPNAMVAPTPVSALLHAVAVVKAGVFSMLMVVGFIIGPGTVFRESGTDILILFPAVTILLASLIAMRQQNLKARLAYSTVSQLSYIVLGALIATPQALTGASLHMVMHAFGKITLFFAAGAIYVATHKTEIKDLDGLGRRMPWTFAAFLLGTLSIIGLPPLGGSWSKWFLMLGSIEADRAWLLVVLAISSLLNIAYLLPIPIRAFFAKGDEAPFSRGGIKEAPFLCVFPPVVTALASIALFFAVQPLWQWIAAIWGAQ